jgi:hypothetical protein
MPGTSRGRWFLVLGLGLKVEFHHALEDVAELFVVVRMRGDDDSPLEQDAGDHDVVQTSLSVFLELIPQKTSLITRATEASKNVNIPLPQRRLKK